MKNRRTNPMNTPHLPQPAYFAADDSSSDDSAPYDDDDLECLLQEEDDNVAGDDDDEDHGGDGSTVLSNGLLRKSKISAPPSAKFFAPTKSNVTRNRRRSRPWRNRRYGPALELVRKLIVAASVTVIFEGLIGHILEFLKIVMVRGTSTTIERACLL